VLAVAPHPLAPGGAHRSLWRKVRVTRSMQIAYSGRIGNRNARELHIPAESATAPAAVGASGGRPPVRGNESRIAAESATGVGPRYLL